MPGVNSECGKHCMDSYSENLSKKGQRLSILLVNKFTYQALKKEV